MVKKSEKDIEHLYDEIQELKNKLNESEKIREVFVNASYDGYWDWKFKEDYEYMSPRFWEIFGYDPKTKKHHPSEWQSIIFKDDLKVALDNFEKHVKSKGNYPFIQEVRYKHQNGSTVTVLCRGKVIEWDENDQPVRIIGTHTDITNLKKKEQELLEQKKKLEQSTNELKQYTYLSNHSLQGPLRHIYSFLQILEESIGDKLTDKEKEIIEFIKYSTKKMKQLINGILEFSSIGNRKLNKVNIDLNELILAITHQIQNTQNVHVAYDNLPTIYADKEMIKQFFMNLFDNSIKFSKKEIPLKITINSNKRNHQWIFSFEDNGVGFNPNNHEKIFNMFHVLNSQIKHDSLGLGLTVCKKIIDLHNGKIWAESEVGQGTKIYFQLN